MSSARTAGKVAFSDFKVQPSAAARNAGKVSFLSSKCNPLRVSCMSIARNAGKVAISDFEVQPSAEMVPVHRAECWQSCACVTWKRVFYKWPCRDPDAEILKERSCTGGPGAGILLQTS